MTNHYTELTIPTHEKVVYCENNDVGLKSWIAIHSTKLGPSLGGCRMWNYNSADEALTDVLRLSEGMTYKAASLHIPLGGGKSVIWGDAATDKSEALMLAMGEFIESLGGQYISGEDVGTTLADMQTIGRVTKFAGSLKGGGDPSVMTAYGVLKGIEASVRYKLNKDNLKGVKVAIQGTGSVGKRLAHNLFDNGAELIVADVNKENVDFVCKNYNAVEVGTDEIHKVDCDVFAPCALGAILNDKTILELQCSIVAGSANNQLLEERHGQMLLDNDILYAPDYVINAGGLANVYCEVDGPYSKNRAMTLTENITNSLINIYNRSKETNEPTNIVADQLAREIIEQ